MKAQVLDVKRKRPNTRKQEVCIELCPMCATTKIKH